MAQPMRHAGFGETCSYPSTLAERGYEDTVEQLLRHEDQPAVDVHTLYR